MNKPLATTLFFAIIGQFGVMFDFIISSMAYTWNPSHFIRYEQSLDIVLFLHNGEVTFTLIYALISVPLVTLLLALNLNHIKTNKPIVVFCYLMITVLIARMMGGLTWVGLQSQPYLPFMKILYIMLTALFTIELTRNSTIIEKAKPTAS